MQSNLAIALASGIDVDAEVFARPEPPIVTEAATMKTVQSLTERLANRLKAKGNPYREAPVKADGPTTLFEKMKRHRKGNVRTVTR